MFSFITHLNTHAHIFAGPKSPGAALIVKSCGTNISENDRDGAFSHNIDHLIYLADPGEARGCSTNTSVTH